MGNALLWVIAGCTILGLVLRCNRRARAAAMGCGAVAAVVMVVFVLTGGGTQH